jgi:hypothetical protein
MRSDRLKQVLLELDPAFDEKALGFQKFNKFLQEAASRGVLSLRKQENGQYELGAPSETHEADMAAAAEERESRRSRGRRGRGRRDERRERPEEAAAPEATEAAAEAAPAPERPAAQAAAEPAAAVKEAAAAPPAAKAEEAKPAAKAAAAAEAAEKPARRQPAAARGDGVGGAYDLLRRAVSDLVKRAGQSARDSDVKRRMLELEPGWDESSVGFSKFSRFLRQAHDDEVVTLRKDENGNYDVVPGNAEVSAEDERGGRRDRDRGRGRDRDRETSEVAAAAAAPAEKPAAVAAVAPAAEKPATLTPTPGPAAAIGFRRGSRGRGGPSGPPPLLEGQTVAAVRAGVQAGGAAPAEKPAPSAGAAEEGEKKPAKRARAGKAAKAKTAAKAPAKKAAKAATSPATTAATTTKSGGKKVDAAAMGLPTDAGEIASYMTQYPGVGPKSVQTLIETFGASGVYDALENEPDRIREVIGGARGERLLEAWMDDIALRRAQRGPGGSAGTAVPKAGGASDGGARKSRGRRGGRRGPKRADSSGASGRSSTK